MRNKSRFNNFTDALRKRGIEQSQAFQCFVSGGISGMCGIGTLLLLNHGHVGLKEEVIALIAMGVSLLGIGMAIVGYTALLLLRLTQPPEGRLTTHQTIRRNSN